MAKYETSMYSLNGFVGATIPSLFETIHISEQTWPRVCWLQTFYVFKPFHLQYKKWTWYYQKALSDILNATKHSYGAPIRNIFQLFCQGFNFSSKIISSKNSTRNHNTGVNSRVLSTRRPITRIRIMRKPTPGIAWPIFNDIFDCLFRICNTFPGCCINLQSD